MKKNVDIERLKYPIGKPSIPTPITSRDILQWIEIINEFPKKLAVLVEPLSEEQLDTKYRSEGWTVR